MPHKEIKNKHGKAIPSVTQILGILSKPFLYRWYGKVGWDECERIKRESSDYGTEKHELVSRFLKGEIIEDSFLAPFCANYRGKPVEVEPEEPYVSLKYGYQGTFDWVERDVDGSLVIADLKITGQMHKEYGLQLSAYAQLWNEAHPDRMITHGRIYRIDKKTGKLQIKEFPGLPKLFKVFKSLIPVYRWVYGDKSE